MADGTSGCVSTLGRTPLASSHRSSLDSLRIGKRGDCRACYGLDSAAPMPQIGNQYVSVKNGPLVCRVPASRGSSKCVQRCRRGVVRYMIEKWLGRSRKRGRQLASRTPTRSKTTERPAGGKKPVFGGPAGVSPQTQRTRVSYPLVIGQRKRRPVLATVASTCRSPRTLTRPRRSWLDVMAPPCKWAVSHAVGTGSGWSPALTVWRRRPGSG